ncbi:cytochrome P450 [Parafrankia sp. EAN1pec]|uniref:cytochrome P450 n=1 Tax=Parafrankia sp. (strain EAN1pec) TaxID=298653 RepID=UPI00015D9FE0|nr:cytochrome P450 [Frankia sp. EAN1pec]
MSIDRLPTAGHTGAQAPGPGRATPAFLRELLADPLRLFTRLRTSYGPIVRVPVGRGGFHLVCGPEAVEQVLVGEQRAYAKGLRRRTMPPGEGIQPLSLLLGSGLLTSGGDLHRTRRRLIQPMFHRERIAGYGAAISELSRATALGWADGSRREVHTDMSELTLAIVARTVFGVDVDSEVVRRVRRAVAANMRLSQLAVLPGAIRLQQHLPIGPLRAARDARDDLTAVVMEMIEQRRSLDAAGSDLLSTLLATRDADTGAPLDDTSIRDEALTILLAGHETTANAMAWAYHLLATNPQARDRMHTELDDVLNGRKPTTADLAELPYTRAVFSETLRLYPPAWILLRRTTRDVTLTGYHLPADTNVLLSQWVIHRDPTWWPAPEEFRPQRWLTPDPTRPKYAYFPFGGGTRQCIGNTFAEMEGALALAAISSIRTLTPTPGRPVTPIPRVTLRPQPLQMTAHPRTPHPTPATHQPH